MTNEELKALIIESIEQDIDYNENVNRHLPTACKLREVLLGLQSGQIFVGQWREDVENAPNTRVLAITVDSQDPAPKLLRHHNGNWLGAFGACPEPDVYAELPAAPKVKP